MSAYHAPQAPFSAGTYGAPQLRPDPTDADLRAFVREVYDWEQEVRDEARRLRVAAYDELDRRAIEQPSLLEAMR